jgi:hypothetical protein
MEPLKHVNIFTPNMLHKWAKEQIAVPMKKKERKRKNKKETMSQPAPTRLRMGHQDPRVLTTSCILWVSRC